MTNFAVSEKGQKFSHMWSLDAPYHGSGDSEGDDLWMTIDKFRNGKYMGVWLEVKICEVREEMTQTGSNYMSVFFRSTEENDPWKIRHNYFRTSQVVGLFKAVKVSHVGEPADLEGKTLEVQIALRARQGREYPKVVSYRQITPHEVQRGA